MHRPLQIPLLLLLVACRTTGDHAIEPLPMGILGSRIGTYLHIEGMRSNRGKTGDQTLLVDRVNGAPLDPPVSIWLENLRVPAAERCLLSGYELKRWIGIPEEVLRQEQMAPPQAMWQAQHYLVVTSVQGPTSLALEFGR